MPRFEYWAACPQLTAEIVQYITDPDHATQVRYRTFARHANLQPLRQADHPAMYRISAPDNWAISFWRSRLPSGAPVYYFDWSRIEHVFVDRPVDFESEVAGAQAWARAQNPVSRTKRHLLRA